MKRSFLSFTREVADNLTRLTPYLEVIELPNGGRRADQVDVGVVDTTVAHLAKLKELRQVSILNWPVTDEHIESLVAIPHLQVLHVYSPHLTKKSLASVRKMKDLRILGIRCRSITPEAAESFHRDRPDVFARFNSVDYGSREGIYVYESLKR